MALPSLRIFYILAIVLQGAGALLFNVMHIQSIGSGLSSFGDLFIFSFFPIDLTNVLYLSVRSCSINYVGATAPKFGAIARRNFKL